MPSPFPGMDPFIEGQKWPDFHHSIISAVRDFLVPSLRPRYVVEVNQQVFVTGPGGEPEPPIEPDVYVVESGVAGYGFAANPRGGAAAQPVLRTTPLASRKRQGFLLIRTRESLEVVTVVEVLSPWNKARGEGRQQYLNKRQGVFETPAHLVEFDLLRGGTRLPPVEPLPDGDYFAFVCRSERLPQVEVYPWALRDRLPSIPVPLSAGDPDVMLDLPQVFATTYDRAGYDYSIDYRRPVAPPLSPADRGWVSEVLHAARTPLGPGDPV